MGTPERQRWNRQTDVVRQKDPIVTAKKCGRTFAETASAQPFLGTSPKSASTSTTVHFLSRDVDLWCLDAAWRGSAVQAAASENLITVTLIGRGASARSKVSLTTTSG